MTNMNSGAPGQPRSKPGCLGWGCLSLAVLAVLGGCGALVKGAGDQDAARTAAASALARPAHSSPTGTPPPGSYQLPNFTGQHLDQVEAVLKAHGLTWDDGVWDQNQSPEDLGPANFYVCAQSPTAGTRLQKGAGRTPTVTVTVVGVDENCDGSPKAAATPTLRSSSGDSSSGGSGGDYGSVGGSTSGDSSGGASSDGSGTSGSVAGAGATALCNDGTYSYSLHHRGTCSHHGGVAIWYR